MVKHPRSQIGCYPEIEIRYRTYVASSHFASRVLLLFPLDNNSPFPTALPYVVSQR